jgi:hypothetical protein
MALPTGYYISRQYNESLAVAAVKEQSLALANDCLHTVLACFCFGTVAVCIL